MIKSFILALTFIQVGCTSGTSLQQYQYGLFRDDDPDGKDRIALVDASIEDAARQNCEALVHWHKIAFPSATDMHCRKIK